MTISDANVAPSAVSHRDMANAIRALAMDAVEAANSGHPGMPMGMADVATVLFTQFLKFDPATPDWPDRDRFVLSAGHGSMLLYALLYLTGYPDIDLEQLRGFRKLGSRTAGHPEYGNAAGIETTTGPLGQGVATAVGMALAERILNARFGDTLVDHHTYVLASDGDLMEGISHEAISLAGHLKLGKLIVLFDDNGISIDGPTDLAVSDDQSQRFAAAGWHTLAVDGHDPQAIGRALDEARLSDRPSFIACRTVIGYGAPTKAGTAATHGAALGESEVAGARERLGWPHPPFTMPDAVLDAWRQAGARGAAALAAWRRRLAQAAPEARNRFEQAIAGTLPEGFDAAIAAFKRRISAEGPALATRQSSGDVLSVINPLVAEMIGGSADLTGSNNTRTQELRSIRPGDFSGRYLHYGVREHAMAAAMNGMALHRGIIPYGGTFLIFSDYCRPAIRLSALMGVRVVYVMTHDSIGLGEDGPTHQPVEQLAGLRAMPNLWVFRPAGAVEVAECWQLALARRDGPSLIALTRQAVPTLRREATAENLSARGAYELRAAEGGAAKVSLLATGSEVAIADAARDLLQAEGVPTRVVSMPCWALFEALPADERRALLGPGTAKVAVEAASPLGWDRYIGPGGVFVGMHGFGESAPYKQLYERFGITKEAVAAAAKALLE